MTDVKSVFVQFNELIDIAPVRISIDKSQTPKDDVSKFVRTNHRKPVYMTNECHVRHQAPSFFHSLEEAFVAMIVEINSVEGVDGWWVDTGVTRHVFYDRSMFKTYMAVEDKKVLLGDSNTTVVFGV
ncbi:hypothetical protein POM88_016755 [Heracleum sosnowskyi]|uniref:Retrovirus-related Pol polyprotein from transposon TNT 1-94-like beta-barrel domain-containing protein n=1 Tax=Heracleum sosnowskyi TaxID=360622 RepID=A0AAD8MXQ1_9APIA|nr:hypothetical protein POM88_016755 [Heracleum sosnowskyi]